MIHRITLGNQLKAISFSVMGTLMMIGALFYFGFNAGFVKVFTIFWLFYTVPAVAVHLIYYLSNKNQQVEISNNEVIFQDQNGKEKKYRTEDLEKIVVYKSASIEKGSIQFTPIESYHYARVIPKTGNEIIITSLMIPDVEEALKKLQNITMEKKRRLFCIPNPVHR